jgi:hypothetical protein
LQKGLEYFFDYKRIQFPRFFFKTNVQYLQLLDLADQCHDFNHLIHLLFPGAANFNLDQPYLGHPDSSTAALPPRPHEVVAEVLY